jgi:chorismate mutase / prephenate dehydratase
MTRLDKDRQKIDEIDEQIAKLFEERFETVRDVIAYKIENRLPILNSDREKEITEKNVKRITDDDIKPYFKAWYNDLLALSKEFQKEIQDEM